VGELYRMYYFCDCHWIDHIQTYIENYHNFPIIVPESRLVLLIGGGLLSRF
jgi:hypothetical protein